MGRLFEAIGDEAENKIGSLGGGSLFLVYGVKCKGRGCCFESNAEGKSPAFKL